jgi:hypothetical protein
MFAALLKARNFFVTKKIASWVQHHHISRIGMYHYLPFVMIGGKRVFVRLRNTNVPAGDSGKCRLFEYNAVVANILHLFGVASGLRQVSGMRDLSRCLRFLKYVLNLKVNVNSVQTYLGYRIQVCSCYSEQKQGKSNYKCGVVCVTELKCFVDNKLVDKSLQTHLSCK